MRGCDEEGAWAIRCQCTFLVLSRISARMMFLTTRAIISLHSIHIPHSNARVRQRKEKKEGKEDIYRSKKWRRRGLRQWMRTTPRYRLLMPSLCRSTLSVDVSTRSSSSSKWRSSQLANLSMLQKRTPLSPNETRSPVLGILLTRTPG